MSNQFRSGFSLKDDIAVVWTNPTFHDVTIVCADGVKLGACRVVLAARSDFFMAMFFGGMHESASKEIALRDIDSEAMKIVLEYIHTEAIGSAAPLNALDVYRAASFLQLPKLVDMALELAKEVEVKVAVPLLNKAIAFVPYSEISKELYDVLFKAFCNHRLEIGDLNDLTDEALELILTRPKATVFNTPEYDLLLCVVEWAWDRDGDAPSITERHAVFDILSDLSDFDIKIVIGNDPSRTALVKMLQHIDFTLICPHRLNYLNEAIDVLTDNSPHYNSALYHACRNTRCSSGHPSKYRGHSEWCPQWDRSKLASVRIVVSEGDTVISLPSAISGSVIAAQITARTARASSVCLADANGICEWDVVVEAFGGRGIQVGLVNESFDTFQQAMSHGMTATAWIFQSNIEGGNIILPSVEKSAVPYGTGVGNGDAITFHLDMKMHNCSLSINGRNYGVIWDNLPDIVYPAVSLFYGTRYRFRARS